MLDEEDLGGAGFVGEVDLGFFAFFAAEGGGMRATSKRGGAPLYSPSYAIPPLRVLPCQMRGLSIPWRTRLARAIG